MKQIRYCLLSCERLTYSTQDKEVVQFRSACGAEHRQGRAAGNSANEVTCAKKEGPEENCRNVALTGTHAVTSSVMTHSCMRSGSGVKYLAAILNCLKLWS